MSGVVEAHMRYFDWESSKSWSWGILMHDVVKALSWGILMYGLAKAHPEVFWCMGQQKVIMRYFDVWSSKISHEVSWFMG